MKQIEITSYRFHTIDDDYTNKTEMIVSANISSENITNTR